MPKDMTWSFAEEDGDVKICHFPDNDDICHSKPRYIFTARWQRVQEGFSGSPSIQIADGGTRTHYRKVPADPRTGSLSTAHFSVKTSAYLYLKTSNAVGFV
ncbi:hypothetical protein PoB_006237900 [Plakobranchus ocellatus]|uniref:Uncharacterized protein n=1 Tax=Plakobranchus ocellatus TaxID=259542 RepID=A0AAV4CVG1_9GAST|nr:hypothetical protein PoB_006237900 [Plakobranchus ocellatus]